MSHNYESLSSDTKYTNRMSHLCILIAVIQFSFLRILGIIPLFHLMDAYFLGVIIVAPILPSVELDFSAQESINLGVASEDATCEVAGPLTLAWGERLRFTRPTWSCRISI